MDRNLGSCLRTTDGFPEALFTLSFLFQELLWHNGKDEQRMFFQKPWWFHTKEDWHRTVAPAIRLPPYIALFVYRNIIIGRWQSSLRWSLQVKILNSV
jgi:hypothetical protein